MSSDSASSEVTYTSISSHGDLLAWAMDFFRLQEPESPEAAPASPDYVPGLEEPEQAPLSPDYIPGPEYLEYLAPSDEEVPIEDQPYAVADSPIALSPGYVADSDPEEDSEDGPVDYPADGGDSDDDDSSNDDEEEEEEEEHLAPTDSVVAPIVDHVPSSEETEPFKTDKYAATPPSPPACRTTARISIRPETPMPFPSEEEVERLLSLPPPPPSPLISLSPPSTEEHLVRYEVGESSTAAPRPVGGHRIDYGFIGTLDAETRRQRAEEVGYGIRDTWVDPREAVKDIAPVTLEGVNTRVTELVAVQEKDTQDIYAMIEDAQDRQTHIFQSVETLIDDRQYHYETARLDTGPYGLCRILRIDAHDSLIAALTTQVSSLQGHLVTTLGEIRALQARDQARADAPEDIASTTVGLVFSFLVSDNHNNIPPRRSSATAKADVAATRAAAAATTPMIVAAVE
ncbi:hypothetical protein Tco_0991951 [Tanacetum coccineum]|uniref:Uncharacterized protein n=1 Tax=Tanacetum coccineum TaxID=301880 RepID=A0ABQ5F121_9ASTR